MLPPELFDNAEAYSASPVNRHSGRFVDDDKCIILEQNFELHVPEIGCIPSYPGLRRFNGEISPGKLDRRNSHDITQAQMMSRLDAPAIEAHLAAAQQPIDVAFRHSLQSDRKSVV